LRPSDSSAVAAKQAAGEVLFELESRGVRYQFDMQQMTQTNMASGRTRTIRIISSEASEDTAIFGFERFRASFRKLARRCDQTVNTAVAGPRPRAFEAVDRQALVDFWIEVEPQERRLAEATADAVMAEMDLNRNGCAALTEWIHYWALERDSPSYHAGREVNEKLVDAIKHDDQILGRMQMHFETAVGEDSGAAERGLSTEGLLRACRRLADSPKDVAEKRWAKEVLALKERGEGLDEDAELNYYDFMNVMLGRKKFKVTLWLYDISNGWAKNASLFLLGHHFDGIWHSGVVIEWPDHTAELWFGGKIFESVPGTTPFGEPMERRDLGYTYKSHDDTLDFIKRHLCSEFSSERYDVLTHNCNHFSEALAQFLMNGHIPDDVLRQPDMVMSTITARALRPVLNRWLGGFESSQDSKATDSGFEAERLWEQALPGALISFSQKPNGRPLVGRLRRRGDDKCRVCSLEPASGRVDREVPRSLVIEVLFPAPLGTAASGEELPTLSVPPERAGCCSLFTVL